jgi:hypothetical protein
MGFSRRGNGLVDVLISMTLWFETSGTMVVQVLGDGPS